MLYYLNAIHIDTSTGVAKASLNVTTIDNLTDGTRGGFDRQVTATPGVQVKLDSIVSDALAYINAKYPGINLTLPPVNLNG